MSELTQNRGIRVEAVNHNTQVNLLRQDVDPNFRIGDLEIGLGLAGRLRAFATRQITTCPIAVIGAEDRRTCFLEELRKSHPVDVVPYFIWLEPMLMLSNLTEAQLKDLLPELHKGTTDANNDSVGRAVSVIQGILIGKASSSQK